MATEMAAADLVPADMVRHLVNHHVLNIGIFDENGPWAASCFYAYDRLASGGIILTDRKTRHGARMLTAPVLAGTISGQPHHVQDVCGIQFVASAILLHSAEAERSLELYLSRHPYAKGMISDIWRLDFLSLKLTDNAVSFGLKHFWERKL